MQQNSQLRTSLMVLVVAATSCQLASAQFLPQSHLGRLVQSITSPLMLAPAAYRETEPVEAPYPDPSSYYPQSGIPPQPMQSTHHYQPEATRQDQGRRLQMLQQAPSQQRGVPQQYYGQPMAHINNGGGPPEQDESREQGAMPSQSEKQRDSASNNNNNNINDGFQMGAYMGPTIDDKEIQGAFNSNDDRDEDDGPSSYDGPSGGKQSSAMDGRHHKAASNAYDNNESPAGGYGSSGADEFGSGQAGAYGAQQPSSAVDSGYRPPPAPMSSYDEEGADEDEPSGQRGPSGGRQPGRGSSLNQAASHYQQQGSYGSGGEAEQQGQQQQQQPRGPLMAAANGYAPFGYAGPVDLTGLMAGVGAGDPSAGYQVYGAGQGDGSYPGANYYQQQGQRGGRNQAASMSNYNTNDGYGPGPMMGARQPQRANNDNDEHDADGDDD